jgi:hypothetical protein
LGHQRVTALATAGGVEVLVLVDNVTDSLSSIPPFVTREWQVLRRRGMKVAAGGALCCANHCWQIMTRSAVLRSTERQCFLQE